MANNRGKHAPWQVAQIANAAGNMRSASASGDITELHRQYMIAMNRLTDNFRHWLAVAEDNLLEELEGK